MRIRNIHERVIAAPSRDVGALLDTLASADDRFWPWENWSPVKFERPLAVGAVGGHGASRYSIAAYAPGRSIRFQFPGPLDGYHEFMIEDVDPSHCRLRHTVEGRATGKFLLRWLLVIRPLHDALIEDLLDKVEGSFYRLRRPRRWGLRVRSTRRMLGMSPLKSQGRL